MTFSSAILFLSQALKRLQLAASPVLPTLHTREKKNQGSMSSFRRTRFFWGRGPSPYNATTINEWIATEKKQTSSISKRLLGVQK